MSELKKGYIQEVSTVRVIACLSIVLLHAIHFTVGFGMEEGSTSVDYVLLTIAGILSFGTPAFVFISELLLAHSYPNVLPKDFYKKRLLLILLPFACMAVLYAILSHYDNLARLPHVLVLNFIGGYHGWFVLVIFQFYILHRLFTKFLSRVPAKVILPVSLAINVAYLAIFNFIEPPSDRFLIPFIWDRGYWVPFFGWFFYFCLAYCWGRDYKGFLAKIKKFQVWIILFVLASLALLTYMNSLNFTLLHFNSKRADMIPLSISLILLLFLAASKWKIRSRLLSLIDRCSFGIYLIHYFYLIVYRVFIDSAADIGYWKIPLLFITALISSIATVLLVNKLPFGKYILGRTGSSQTGTEVNLFVRRKRAPL
ncbi:acyltransferase family protein [Saccharibacillus kuerlensis]|uniref:Membrane-bound acyltransferase YfiQ n=1 Tax=Saccharibacillus kuerlensis TaxID=459527 RepID=A0ABQ2L8N2_9BACL|nr:acyltransferase family protein [Saccharibacillus kuerlensis]GGO06568.1 putative membrane-bound acyltransferase YfiQ [Saccharibacillus kuerlensis]